jgi:hypothetical protein
MPNCCRDCEHWNLPDELRVIADARAACNLILGSKQQLSIPAYVNVIGGQLITSPDYGCVQFEPAIYEFSSIGVTG